MAKWSEKRWSAEAIAARKAAEAGVIPPAPVISAPAPPKLPLPPPVNPLVDEKWMARFGGKYFYFTAKGFKAAESRASSFFRTTCEFEITWLGIVPC
jgi:hypothetical protein